MCLGTLWRARITKQTEKKYIKNNRITKQTEKKYIKNNTYDIHKFSIQKKHNNLLVALIAFKVWSSCCPKQLAERNTELRCILM